MSILHSQGALGHVGSTTVATTSAPVIDIYKKKTSENNSVLKSVCSYERLQLRHVADVAVVLVEFVREQGRARRPAEVGQAEQHGRAVTTEVEFFVAAGV